MPSITSVPAVPRRQSMPISAGGVLVGLAGLALLGLSWLARSVPYFDIDLRTTRAVQAINLGAFDAAMRIVGAPGYPPQVYLVIVVMLGILWAFKLRREALAEVFAVLGIGIVGLIIKLLVARPRPTPDLVNVMTTLDKGQQSYPAGHVESYVAIIGFLWYLSYTLLPNRSLSRLIELVIYGTMIALIGLSRIYVGEHWLSDVIGGYLLGGIWLWLTIQVYKRAGARALTPKGAAHDTR